MRRLFWHWAISAIALVLTAAAIHVPITPWYNAIWLAPIFGLVNVIVGFLVNIISIILLPLNLLTLGCFGFILSFGLYTLALYWLCNTATGPLAFALSIPSWTTAALLAIIMALFSTVLNMVLPGGKRRR